MKINLLFFAILSLFCLACKKQENEQKSQQTDTQKEQQTSQKDGSSNPSTLISCEGIGKVKFAMNYAELEKAYGEEQLETDTVFAGTSMIDGEKIDEDRIYTTVKAPEGKIYITWAAGKVAKEIEKISINIADKPQYQFDNGIKVGSSLEEIRKANTNGDFEFYGIGWQYGGVILNENATGDFFKSYPCFTGELHPKNDTYDKLENLMGEHTFKASQVGSTEAQELILGGITLVKKANQ